MGSSSDIIVQEANLENEDLHKFIHITNHIFSFINSMSLKCALELSIFDTIHNNGGKPMSISDLSQALSLPPQKAQFLIHLMQVLVHSGYLQTSHPTNNSNKDEEGQNYSLTPTAHLLLQDHPFTMKPLALMALDPLRQRAWHSLSGWFRANDQQVLQTPFAFANNGMTLWDYTRREPEFNTIFNDAMAGDTKLLISVLLENNVIHSNGFFSELSSLVDVAGGTGEFSRAIAQAYPDMKCTVFDLPQVVCGLQGTHNLSFVAGDMFKAVPSADAVLIKWALHNWTDEDVVKILKQCLKAITSNEKSSQQRKVMLIDVVMSDDQQKKEHKLIETLFFYDLEMMVQFMGKERREKEWKKLFEDAGFTGGYKVYPLPGVRSLIEVYP